MKYKYYAIKVGNNVKDLIVNSWEECQKHVIGYPSIYKSFVRKKDANNFLKSMTDNQVEERLLFQSIQRRKRLRETIQQKFDFKVTDYILDAIIDKESYNNICLLINMAFLNKRINKKEERVLKRYIQNNKSK